MTVSAIYMASLLDCGYASHGNFLENGEKLPAVQEKITVHLVVKKCFRRLNYFDSLCFTIVLDDI